MAIKTIAAAESWDAIYKAFENVNFTSFDYYSIKESIIDQLKIFYPENFNDFIESSELIEWVEMISYAAELLAYKIDMSAHDNSIADADRKQSVLKLAKFLSYKPTRNIPARGLVKVTSISTTEEITDSAGVELSNRDILWNDPNNSSWNEQFFLVVNRVIKTQVGQPIKAYNISDVAFQLYELDNDATSFKNSVFKYQVNTTGTNIPMEIVAGDLDENGPFEKSIDGSSSARLFYLSDGLGNSSDLTGFMFYTKQGQLSKSNFSFDSPVPNQFVTINKNNINETDVWINKVSPSGSFLESWKKVENVNGDNIQFNTISTNKKYEITSLENDQIRVVFGDGDFGDIPLGSFDVWTRQSINQNIIINKNRVVDVPLSFTYTSNLGVKETCTMTFSLVQTLQNGSESEDIEHIRTNAPLTYNSQARLVNGEDYNTLPLKNQSILKLVSVNRTFAGQSKYLPQNEASGNYQNVKIFGDDLSIYLDFRINSVSSTVSGRVLIDQVIEPLLSSTGILNAMTYLRSIDEDLSVIRTIPRVSFIESSGLNIFEKTIIQGAIDSHYYGDPSEYVQYSGDPTGTLRAEVTSDPDHLIYEENALRISEGQPLPPSGLQQTITEQQKFGLRFLPTRSIFGNGNITSIAIQTGVPAQTFTIESIDFETFTITGSVSGKISNTASVGSLYNDEILSFNIIQGSTVFSPGDAFVIEWDGSSIPTTSSLNTYGLWEIINSSDVSTSTGFDLSTSGEVGTNSDESWLILVERNEDSFGSLLDWSITYRDFKIIAESETTSFWYNSNDTIIDSETKKTVRDKVNILKSNLDIDKTLALGKNISFEVVGAILDESSGSLNSNALEIYPVNNIDAITDVNNSVNSTVFSTFVNMLGSTPDFVYFKISNDGTVSSIVPTSLILALFTSPSQFSATDILGNNYFRRFGRSDLDFLWQHFSPNTNLIDPSTSNINDIFVLTKGYYDSVTAYVQGVSKDVPIPPSSLELRTTYSDLYNAKMLSDTIVMHSGKVKLLFGELADQQLRAKFRVIKSPYSTLTDDQIKLRILDLINEYFDIRYWNFGSTFYVTELLAIIHTQLVNEIASVVIVPTYSNNSFGSLFVIESGQDEIFQSAAIASNIEIVANFTPTVLRQKI